MVTLEQVSKRIFSEPNWFVKTVVGAILMFFPVPFVFAFGYIYRVSAMARRGEPPDLPDWEDWPVLWFDGLRMLAIVLGLAILPIVAGWLVSLPLRIALAPVPFYSMIAPFLYLPLVPGMLLSFPLTAAGLYRFQRAEEMRDAFRIPMLLRMVVATKGRLVLPTLAYLGLVVALFPLFPYALFTGGVVVFYYSSAIFRQIEQSRRSRVSAQAVARRYT
jgi:hypothetical protein